MRKVLAVLFFVLLSASQAQAVPTTFAWTDNNPPGVTKHFNLHCGTESGVYTTHENVGNVTSFQKDMTGTFYCAMTSVIIYQDRESGVSNECSNIGASAPGGFSCTQ